MEIVAFLLVILVPIGWLISEFFELRGLRILLGVLAIGDSFLIASFMGSLNMMGTHEYYQRATERMLMASATSLEKRDSDEVLEHLQQGL